MWVLVIAFMELKDIFRQREACIFYHLIVRLLDHYEIIWSNLLYLKNFMSNF